MTTNKDKNYDFFFWLGSDGEAHSVTEKEFNELQSREREQRRKWKEVDLGND